MAEVLPPGECGAWTAECRVDSIEDVIDLSIQSLELSRPILVSAMEYSPARSAPDRSAAWKPEYYIPRYVADCARSRGFAGIKYTSVRTGGTNLVLFLDRRDKRISVVSGPQLRMRGGELAQPFSCPAS